MATPNVDAWLMRGLMFPFALLFVIPPIYKLWGYAQHRLASATVRAEVVHVESGVFMLPELRYEDDTGQLHQFKSETPFYFLWAPRPGEHVTVHYLRTHPDVVRTESFFYYIFYPAVFLLWGLLLLWYVVRPRTRPPA